MQLQDFCFIAHRFCQFLPTFASDENKIQFILSYPSRDDCSLSRHLLSVVCEKLLLYET